MLKKNFQTLNLKKSCSRQNSKIFFDSDVLLVHLKKDPLFKITIPSRQSYMAAAKPILMAVEGDAAQLVHESSGGLIAEPDNLFHSRKNFRIFANVT